MKNLDISALTDRDPAECFVLVFDRLMNLVGMHRPGEGITPDAPGIPDTPAAPVEPAPVEYSVTAAFAEGKISIKPFPDTSDCFVSIMGLSDWTPIREFYVPPYQIAEGKSFTIKARWNGAVEREVVVSTSGSVPAEVPPVEVPAEPAPANKTPDVTRPAESVECVGNRHIFNPVIEWKGKKARIVAKDAPDGLFYWISGGVPQRELASDFLYDPGDQVTIYAALTDNPDVYYGDFRPAYSVITIPQRNDDSNQT